MFCSFSEKDGSICARKNCKKHAKVKPVCSICLEYPDVEMSLQCKHTFCFHCIYKWTSRNDTCPCCRTSTRLSKVKRVKRVFIDGCDARMKRIKKADSLTEKREKTIDFFKFLTTNYGVLGVLSGNVEFMDICIRKCHQLSTQYTFNNRKILKKLKAMNERFKEKQCYIINR